MAMPFVVGQWVKGDRFYGRGALLQEILHGQRNCTWLLGTRRIGKTSLLKQLEHLASQPQSGYLPVFFDFQGAASAAELHQYFADALLDAEERLERAGVPLADLEADGLFAALERLRRRLRSTGLRLLLLCDEVEELIQLDRADPALLGKLRRALQSRDDVRSVLASTPRLWALAGQRGDTSPFLHGFTPPLYIRGLTDEEARSLVRQDHLAAELRPALGAPAVERVRERCDNHPYLVQLVCKRFLETGDLEEALDQVAADEMVRHFFSVDFEILSEEERQILRFIATQTAATSGSIQARPADGARSPSGGLRRLEELGFVRRDAQRRFVVANSFFRRWLQELAARERLPAAAAAPRGGTGPGKRDVGSLGGASVSCGLIGAMLLHYRIVRRLGEGGMGQVYAAEDTRLGRQVALKLLPPEMAADRDRLERFEREARALAALNHPHIVTVYAVEAVEDLHFMTMELLAGRTLAELMARRLPLETILGLALPLVDALAAAHARGIIHRDLKPANVIVAEDLHVKLLDFGVAVFREAPGGVDTWTDTELRTAPGTLVGTLPYMSPEQIQGRPVDPRSDLFSLGTILYEALAGTRPFRGGTPAELLSAILRDAPRPLAELRPDLPPQVGAIVGRCLEKDPQARYASAADLHRALAALKGDRDAPAPGPALGPRWPGLLLRLGHLARRVFRRS